MPFKLGESTVIRPLKYFTPGDNQVFYSPAEDDCIELQQYIIDNYGMLRTIFKQEGLDFVYPSIQIFDAFSDEQIQDTVRYYFPWESGTDIAVLRNEVLLRCSWLHEGQRPRKPSIANASGRRFGLYADEPDSFEEQFRKIARAFRTPKGTYDDTVHFMIVSHSNALEDDETYKQEQPKEESDYSSIRYSVTSYSYKEDAPIGVIGEPESDIVAPDDELDRMFRQLRANMPEWAIKEMLSQALRTNEVVSRLVIAEQFKLILPDYNNMEIKMTPKEKALYLLFLRHPEGLRLKLLSEHKDELGKIYRKLAKRDVKQVIEDTIENMSLSITGDADVQRSRIKTAINKVFADNICKDYGKWYVISGTKGGLMRIELPQDKIIWKVDI